MTYVALLRGINVGGNNLVPMAKLKITFEKLGFFGITTFIASGNVVFKTSQTAAGATKKIEAAIVREYKIPVKVLVLDLKRIGKIVKAIPPKWVNDASMKCDVMFLWKAVDKKSVLKEFPFNPKLEDWLYVPGAVVWRIDRARATQSKVFKRIIGSKLHRQMTIRNPNTVRKLYALMQEINKA